jgi:ATP-dependent Clp protease ATP-binding subunit ClpA
MPILSRNLERTLRRALALANARQHEYATLEHLLMALTEDGDATAVLEACAVGLDRLRANLNDFLDHELTRPEVEGVADAKPTAGVQRVLQRAASHVQSAGRSEVTGANVLVALFSERESHAVFFLQEQNMSRLDAVNYISHGIAKGAGMSERRRVRSLEWDALRIAQGSEALAPYGAKLDQILGRTLALANARQQPYATLDHLLMALTDEGDAAAVLQACAVDVDRMRANLNDVLDGQPTSLTVEDAPNARPTVSVQRVLLRVTIDARRFGSSEATGANLLAALFSERDYQARQGHLDTRYKVLLRNHDDMPMELVAEVLERFFAKGREDAARIMLHVHTDGVGNCGVYTYEIAETKVTQVIDFARQHQHPLQCTMEKD